MTPPTPSTSRAPKAFASGPAIRYPTGTSASEPIQSYALTRESEFGAMWYASAVSHQIINSENPKPFASATTMTSGSGAPSANTQL